jgi:hypothetical protein
MPAPALPVLSTADPSRRSSCALSVRAVAAPPAPVEAVPDKVLSTSRYDDQGITMNVVKRTQQGAVTYNVEVASDNQRPDCVLHWAVNDWALPAQVRVAASRAHQ